MGTKTSKKKDEELNDEEIELSSDPHAELTDEIQRSQEFKRTSQILKDMFGNLKISALVEEVEHYQRERGCRKPIQLINNPSKTLIQYAAEDASYRSRVSYIQSKSRRLANKARFIMSSFHDFLTARYSNRVKGTVAIKNAFIADLTAKMRVKIESLESLDESCSLLIEDIDQGQWQRKAIISVLEIEARPEGKV